MARSALAGVFENIEEDATYTVATGGTTVDEYGNAIPETTTATLRVSFRPYAFSSLRYQLGTDAKVMPGRAACVNPSALPAGLGVGSVLTMPWNGQAGQLTITSVVKASLAVLDQVLGQEFIAEWRPT